jgi:DNA-nicking Smr family endonuclease
MVRGRKKRTLSDDERALWNEVRKTLDKTHKPATTPIVAPKRAPVVAPRQLPDIDLSQLSDFGARPMTAAQNRYNLAPDPSVAPGVSALDRRTIAKLRTGRERPQGRLDLHGMFLSEAHDALMGFIRRSHSEGKKMVLVITGKGKPAEDALALAPHRRGVLRHALPQWLASPGLAPLVLRVSPAQQRDGGSGAWYVWLRRAGK